MSLSSPEFLKIQGWTAQARLYPPSEIFFQKYGKEAKAEERIQNICEVLYRFSFGPKDPNVLHNLAQAYRDAEVLFILGTDGVKPEFIQGVRDALYSAVKDAVQALDALHKKDQILQKYYESWKTPSKELLSTVHDLFKQYL